MKRIMVATDGSRSSTEAVAFGIELAAEQRAELIFVHVVPFMDVVPATGFVAYRRRVPARGHRARSHAPGRRGSVGCGARDRGHDSAAAR